MEKAVCSNGQFRNLVGNLNMMPENIINQMDGTLTQKAIDELGCGKTQAEFVKWVNNGCQLNILLINSFVVGDIFRHFAGKGDCNFYLDSNFQDWVINPNLKKVIPVRIDIGKLSEYYLPKKMDDSSIQSNAGNPGLMELEVFFCVMYLLVFQPELAKQVFGFILNKIKRYLFHVMVNGKKLVFDVYWYNDSWNFYADTFDRGDDWDEDWIFISF